MEPNATDREWEEEGKKKGIKGQGLQNWKVEKRKNKFPIACKGWMEVIKKIIKRRKK